MGILPPAAARCRPLPPAAARCPSPSYLPIRMTCLRPISIVHPTPDCGNQEASQQAKSRPQSQGAFGFRQEHLHGLLGLRGVWHGAEEAEGCLLVRHTCTKHVPSASAMVPITWPNHPQPPQAPPNTAFCPSPTCTAGLQ